MSPQNASHPFPLSPPAPPHGARRRLRAPASRRRSGAGGAQRPPRGLRQVSFHLVFVCLIPKEDVLVSLFVLFVCFVCFVCLFVCFVCLFCLFVLFVLFVCFVCLFVCLCFFVEQLCQRISS